MIEFDPARLVRVVKEIDGLKPTPAGNLIHHPGKLDGVCTGEDHFFSHQSHSPSSKLDGVCTGDRLTA